MDKNWNFGQKSKFWTKSKILVKNRNFGQQFKFWSKSKILVKNPYFCQKPKFWSKIVIFVKKQNFGQKSLFWSKSKILVKKFGPCFKLWLVFDRDGSTAGSPLATRSELINSSCFSRQWFFLSAARSSFTEGFFFSLRFSSL